MKTRLLRGIMIALALVTGVFAGSRDVQWKKVEEAQQKGLPKTAIEELDPIIAASIAEKSYAEAIKAIGKKIALEGNIQGNKPEEKIVRLEAALATAPEAMKPMMEAVLAHWYWQYFQQNGGRFVQRTEIAADAGKDLQAWDLATILAEIGKHFTAALADEKALKATPVKDYNQLLEGGTVPDSTC